MVRDSAPPFKAESHKASARQLRCLDKKPGKWGREGKMTLSQQWPAISLQRLEPSFPPPILPLLTTTVLGVTPAPWVSMRWRMMPFLRNERGGFPARRRRRERENWRRRGRGKGKEGGGREACVGTSGGTKFGEGSGSRSRDLYSLC